MQQCSAAGDCLHRDCLHRDSLHRLCRAPLSLTITRAGGMSTSPAQLNTSISWLYYIALSILTTRPLDGTRLALCLCVAQLNMSIGWLFQYIKATVYPSWPLDRWKGPGLPYHRLREQRGLTYLRTSYDRDWDFEERGQCEGGYPWI